MSKELKQLAETVAQLTELVTELSLAIEPEAPSVTTKAERAKFAICGATTKAGTPCLNGEGKCPHHEGIEEAEVAPVEEAPKEVKYLCKSTRPAFEKAVKEGQGVSLKGWSNLDIAASVLAGEVEAPEGFDIGEGYKKVVAEHYDI